MSNTQQSAAHDAQQEIPGVYTGSKDVHSRTRVRGGLPSLPKDQAEETESIKGLSSDVIHESRELTLEFANEESIHLSLKLIQSCAALHYTCLREVIFQWQP